MYSLLSLTFIYITLWLDRAKGNLTIMEHTYVFRSVQVWYIYSGPTTINIITDSFVLYFIYGLGLVQMISPISANDCRAILIKFQILFAQRC